MNLKDSPERTREKLERRRSSAASPVRSKKSYTRKSKHAGRRSE